MEDETKLSLQANLHRLFVDNKELLDFSDQDELTIQLTGEQYNYLINVLRLEVANNIYLFNNTDRMFLAELTSAEKGSVNLKVLKAQPVENESTVQIVLLQGVPKGDKLELIIQKTTELGISQIVPISSKHSIKKLSDKKMPRFEKIAQEASRQSKRSMVPDILNPITVNSFLDNTKLNDEDIKILLTQGGDKSLKDILSRNKPVKIYIAIGPEGDFSDDEKERFLESGFAAATLGNRVLRTETAAIAVTGIVQYETDNLQ